MTDVGFWEYNLRRQYQEKERQQQLADAQRHAQEEADRIKKLADEKTRAEKKNNISTQETESKQSMASEEVQLTIDKEKRRRSTGRATPPDGLGASR